MDSGRRSGASGPAERVSEFEVLYRANVAAVTAYFARRPAGDTMILAFSGKPGSGTSLGAGASSPGACPAA